MKIALPSLGLLLLGLATFAAVNPVADSPFDAAEVSGIEYAVMDYVEGIYNVEPDRIERSVSKDLVKYGFWRKSADSEYRGTAMNFEQLTELAGSWNTDNRQELNDKSPKEIVVLDVLDQTATAKLTAHWGIDYFQLEKTGEKWMIRHVLWQSHPAK
ncbi:MAG: hypothetical protein HKN13_03125 [Rhodothermales bacterium]|nr:hypothetical protein [Rhodothermales bacterium]